MKVLLLRRSRIWHNAGEIVAVSPAEAGFLLSVGAAVNAPEKKKAKETPEDVLTGEIEKPEEPATLVETQEEKSEKPEEPATAEKPKKARGRKSGS